VTAKSITHKFVQTIADGTDGTLIRPSNWNDDHNLWLGYRAVTITTDAITSADHLTLITYNNAGGVAVSLPLPSSANIPLGWRAKLFNLLGNVTITPASTINGSNTPIVLARYESIDLWGTGTADYIGVITRLPTAKPFSTGIKTFTASGSYTPTLGMIYCDIECVGGGGGGGGIGDSTGVSVGVAGGGAGGYSRHTVSTAAIGASQVVTIGAGGAGGTGSSGGNSGSSGGTTSVGAICVANGGAGGGGMNASWQGGAGGSITGAVGDVMAAGAPGGPGSSTGATVGFAVAGNGGSSYFGGGGRAPGPPADTVSTVGGAATNYGSGGSGAAGTNTATVRAGGAGSAGVVVITEFFG
jgi:hypothetical protein